MRQNEWRDIDGVVVPPPMDVGAVMPPASTCLPVPGERTGLVPWVFRSSKEHSARVAGRFGLSFVAGYPSHRPRHSTQSRSTATLSSPLLR